MGKSMGWCRREAPVAASIPRPAVVVTLLFVVTDVSPAPAEFLA